MLPLWYHLDPYLLCSLLCLDKNITKIEKQKFTFSHTEYDFRVQRELYRFSLSQARIWAQTSVGEVGTKPGSEGTLMHFQCFPHLCKPPWTQDPFLLTGKTLNQDGFNAPSLLLLRWIRLASSPTLFCCICIPLLDWKCQDAFSSSCPMSLRLLGKLETVLQAQKL